MSATGTTNQGEIRPRRTRTQNADLDITPMIDIVFLLLAFFVMVSKMDPRLPVRLPHAEHGVVVSEQQSVIVVMTPGENQQPQVYRGLSLAEGSLISGEPEDQEQAVEAYVEAMLRENPEFPQLLLKAESGLRMGDLERIKRAAQRPLGDRATYLGVEDR